MAKYCTILRPVELWTRESDFLADAYFAYIIRPESISDKIAHQQVGLYQTIFGAYLFINISKISEEL